MSEERKEGTGLTSIRTKEELSSLIEMNDELLIELDNSLKTLQDTVDTLKDQSKGLTESFDGVETQFRSKFQNNWDDLIKKATDQINNLNEGLVEFCNKNYELISDQAEKMDTGVSQSFREGVSEFLEKVGEHMGHIGESRSYAIQTAYKHLEVLGSNLGDRNIDLIKNVINEMDNALHRIVIDLNEYSDQIAGVQSAMSKAAIGEIRKSIGKAVESIKPLLDKLSEDSEFNLKEVRLNLENIRNEFALAYTSSKDSLTKMVSEAEAELKTGASKIRVNANEARTDLSNVLSEKATQSGKVIADQINVGYQQMESDLLAVFEAYVTAVETFRDSIEEASLAATKPLIETLDKERDALLNLLDSKREDTELELADLQQKLENFSKTEMISSFDQIKEIYRQFIEDTESAKEDLNKKASTTVKMLESIKKKVSESKALLT